MTQLPDVIADLTAEGDSVDQMVADLRPDQWTIPTPAPGWTIGHQIAHLTATFRMAGMAAADPTAFVAMTAGLSDDFDANVTAALSEYLTDPPGVLRARWQAERATAVKALAAVPPGHTVPWLVTPLPPAVLAAAGMMELFGHGQDIADALGVPRHHTDRIRHVTAFAVRTWEFGYHAHGLTPPQVEFRYELTSPTGALWTFGPPDSPERVGGPAVDFCLLVTRRRHHRDLNLTVSGDHTAEWLTIAQAYRGPAGPGRAPGQFPTPVTRG
ncbi:MAG TPA: TIGR03084 family metal-binding protein [Mycobacteriales bacterium]